MKGGDNAALDQAPKRFNVLRVNLTANVDAFAMLDDPMGIDSIQSSVSGMLVGGEQTDVGDTILPIKVQSFPAGIFDHLANHIALAADNSDDAGFAGSLASGFVALLVPVAVLVFAADVVSSTSTMPINCWKLGSCIAARRRWHIYQAVR